ncbi:unnamed protein product [Prunus armeniaca]
MAGGPPCPSNYKPYGGVKFCGQNLAQLFSPGEFLWAPS